MFIAKEITCRLLTFWKIIPCYIIIAIIILSFCSLLCLAFSISLRFNNTSLNNQLIVSNQTISFDPGWHIPFCNGVYIEENVISYSDNRDGLTVTGYSVDNPNVENVTIPSTEYRGWNQSIEDGSRHYPIPLNYFSYPLYLLKNSIIFLQAKIDLLESKADKINSVVVHFFDSREEAARFQLTGSYKKSSCVHQVDITECIHMTCTYNITVTKDSFYFFMLNSSADSEYLVTTNFTFHVVRYAYPFPAHSNVTQIDLNTTGFIPFHSTKKILLFTHPPPDRGGIKIGHLNFTTHTSFSKPLSVIALILSPLMFLISFVIILGLVLYCCRKIRRRPNSVELEAQVGERAPLLDSNETPTNSYTAIN